MVGSLKNGDSQKFDSSGGFVIEENDRKDSEPGFNGNNSGSSDEETDLVIGPMPPKRKVDSDEENDDILGSTNVGTVGKLEVNKTGIASKFKIKPINITLKTKILEKNEDEKENFGEGIDNSEFEKSDNSLEMDKSVEITEINEKSDTDGLDRIRETKTEDADSKTDKNESNEPKNAETPKIIGSSSSNSETDNFRPVLVETSDSNSATETKIKDSGDSGKSNDSEKSTNPSPATSTSSSASSLLPRKRKSGELLPSANSTENGSTNTMIESIQEENFDDIESTSSKVRKTEFDVNAAKLASEKNNHKIKENSNTLSDTKSNGN
jgi:hypothetical protein